MKTKDVADPPVFDGKCQDDLETIFIDKIGFDTTFDDKSFKFADFPGVQQKLFFRIRFVDQLLIEPIELAWFQGHTTEDVLVDLIVHTA